MKTNVMRILEKRGIAYRPKPHSRTVYTSAEAAQERGVRLSQIVKTMLLKLPDGSCVVALIPGDRRLSLKQMRKLLGVRKLGLIEREDVRKVTGYEPGAVSPIGMKRHYPTYCDEAILLKVHTGQVRRGYP